MKEKINIRNFIVNTILVICCLLLGIIYTLKGEYLLACLWGLQVPMRIWLSWDEWKPNS